MSYLSSEYVQCETLQTMLNDQFEAGNTPLDAMPALEAILATQKANGIAQTVSDGNGKVKNVKVVYDQRLLESAVTSGSGARSCTNSNETFDNYANYTIDPTVWLTAGEKFDTVDLATVCTTDVQGMIAKKLGKVMDAMERKIATKTATELVALYGAWGSDVTVNGSTEFEVASLISAATAQIDYRMWANLDLAFMQTGYSSAPIIFSGTQFYQASRFAEAGCCSTLGADVGELAAKFGKAVFYDRRIESALGAASKAIAIQSGSVALITYNEAAQVANLGANYAKFKMFSPRTGLPIDVVMKDDCGTIYITAYANTKLVGLPTDMFAAGDQFRGVTFVNKIKMVNPA